MSTKTRFTKGEWKISSCGLSVKVNGSMVARAHSGGNTPYVEPTKANAHLIAAAPEMYEMLNEIAISMECFHGVDTESIFELLAKARGEL